MHLDLIFESELDILEIISTYLNNFLHITKNICISLTFHPKTSHHFNLTAVKCETQMQNQLPIPLSEDFRWSSWNPSSSSSHTHPIYHSIFANKICFTLFLILFLILDRFGMHLHLIFESELDIFEIISTIFYISPKIFAYLWHFTQKHLIILQIQLPIPLLEDFRWSSWNPSTSPTQTDPIYHSIFANKICFSLFLILFLIFDRLGMHLHLIFKSELDILELFWNCLKYFYISPKIFAYLCHLTHQHLIIFQNKAHICL